MDELRNHLVQAAINASISQDKAVLAEAALRVDAHLKEEARRARWDEADKSNPSMGVPTGSDGGTPDQERSTPTGVTGKKIKKAKKK